MISKPNKNEIRKKRHLRVRKKISGDSKTPRLNVYRSINHIYAQIIDDTKGHTLVACSTLEKGLQEALKGKTKQEQARIVGQEIAQKALKSKIEKVVFDRGGYLYTGRIKQLADGAREAGLKF
ncbi:MAG: 50S ribosomal protein L18 [Clostridiales bacterium]|jgi:large subunit ribosomal protein L18|nr:50S ribosomal protein L18 [Clostridiales bacterium]